jgi:creatinine amidohydrolase
MLLDDLTWPEVKELDFARLVSILPLGSFEQHGPHLPFSTDTKIVTAVAAGVEAARSRNVLLLPSLWPGHSTHHRFFPGTLSVLQMDYIRLIIDLCGSIVRMGARRIFLLNGHGGNDVPVRAALRELKSSLEDVSPLHLVFASYWSLAAQTIKQVRESELGGVSHDGPQHPSPYRKADMQLAKPVYYVSEFNELSDTGTIGHPDLATPEKGKRFLDGIVADVTSFVDDFLTW